MIKDEAGTMMKKFRFILKNKTNVFMVVWLRNRSILSKGNLLTG